MNSEEECRNSLMKVIVSKRNLSKKRGRKKKPRRIRRKRVTFHGEVVVKIRNRLNQRV